MSMRTLWRSIFCSNHAHVVLAVPAAGAGAISAQLRRHAAVELLHLASSACGAVQLQHEKANNS
jgi:di/tricarboxylate transporter